MAVSFFDLFGFFIWAGFALLVLSGMVIGACLYHLRAAKKPKARRSYNTESGNMFFALFAAVAMMGMLGAGMSAFMRGPVSTVSNVTRHNMAQSDMLAATALISRASLAAEDADCDEDGFIEPLLFRDAGPAPAPSGGGLVPDNVAANRRDPWGVDYAYCVWDNGPKIKDAACGGAGANRRGGNNAEDSTAIAVISAGRDKVFQTSCHDWVDESTPVAVKPEDSDDIVRVVPYGQFLFPASGGAKLEDLPDEACTPQTVGVMRIVMENTVQVCTLEGWTEIGASTQGGDFEHVVNAILSHEYTSNAISFSGFFGSRPVIVEGGAALLINGNPASPPYSAQAGDTLALRANAPPSPEQSAEYSITINSVRKTWRITTRDKSAAALTITPSAATLNVTGPGSPAYGADTPFLVRNTGERETAELLAAALSNTANYEFTAALGDDCGGKVLAYDETCAVEIRSKSSGEALPAATLTVTDGTPPVTATASLMGNVSGWQAPPGEEIFSSVGTHEWIVPMGVSSISVACIGGGSSGGGGYGAPSNRAYGGGGGGTAYRNNIPVSSGEVAYITVGAGGMIPGSSQNHPMYSGQNSRFVYSASGVDFSALGANLTTGGYYSGNAAVGYRGGNGGSGSINDDGSGYGGSGGDAATYISNGNTNPSVYGANGQNGKGINLDGSMAVNGQGYGYGGGGSGYTWSKGNNGKSGACIILWGEGRSLPNNL